MNQNTSRKFGLIGYPIQHSQSPALFEQAYGGRYPYELIEDESFDVCWKKFLSEYEAVNVTAPYKELAFEKSDCSTEDCDVLGACNVLVKRYFPVSAQCRIVEEDEEFEPYREKIVAYNTDWMAVRDILQKEKPRGSVLVVGAGGAGKAAAYAAVKLGYEVFLANRTFKTAEDFAQRLSKKVEGARVHPIGLDEMDGAMEYCGSVIWCTPKRVDMPVLGVGSPEVLVVEANYRDPVLSDAPRYVDGMQWLRAQARACFPILTGEKPLGLEID